MRRILQLSMLGLALGAGSACAPEKIFDSPVQPTAGIRFVNAVPDTGAVDFRPVDIVENSTFYGVAFRSTTLLFYKNARAGSRHFRIFQSLTSSTLPAAQQQAIASKVLVDTVVTLEAGKRYTFILWGFARTGSQPARVLKIIEDDPADPGAQVALRVINAAAGLGALDVRQYPSTGTAPATPTWAAVPALSVSNYVNVAVGGIRYNVQPAGGGAALFADATAPAGSAAVTAPPGPFDAIPGTTVAGSAVTGIIFPRSVAGSPAPNLTTPAIVFVWDRRPPRPPGV